MNSTTEQVFDAALQLTTGDRAVLVDALLASLRDEGEPPFDESWRAIIERRSEELRSGAVTPVPWQSVKRQAWERTSG